MKQIGSRLLLITDHTFEPLDGVPEACGYRRVPAVIHNPCRWPESAHVDPEHVDNLLREALGGDVQAARENADRTAESFAQRLLEADTRCSQTQEALEAAREERDGYRVTVEMLEGQANMCHEEHVRAQVALEAARQQIATARAFVEWHQHGQPGVPGTLYPMTYAVQDEWHAEWDKRLNALIAAFDLGAAPSQAGQEHS
jgi:hypothetical protein